LESPLSLPLGSEGELRAELSRRGVPVDEWGTAGAKAVRHLLLELREDDCRLSELDGFLVRHVRAVELTVTARRWLLRFRLVEERQLLGADRTERRRNLPYSVGEKVKAGEGSLDAARRGLLEELGIADLVRLRQTGYSLAGSPRPSPSYPGLPTSYAFYRFTCRLPRRLVKSAYREETPDLVTEFRWKLDSWPLRLWRWLRRL
jgi:hypothetical protein